MEANIMSILQLVESDREAQRDKLENLLQEFSVTHVRKSAGGALSAANAAASRLPVLWPATQLYFARRAFAGIDPIAISDIRELVAQLKDRGLGVLITDHNVRETLSIIDRAVIMHDGHVLTEGTADEIVNNEAVRAHYLGDDFTLNAPLIDCRLDSGHASGTVMSRECLEAGMRFHLCLPTVRRAARVVLSHHNVKKKRR